MRTSPRGDNTIAASLTPAHVAPEVLNILTNRLAPLRALSLKVSTSPLAPRSTVQVPLVTVGPTAQTNPTSWENGDTTVEARPVVCNQFANSYHVSNDQSQQGHSKDAFAIAAANALASTLMDQVTVLLKVANGFATHVIGPAADFSVDDMPSIYGLCRDFPETNLILDHAYLAQLIPSDRNSLTVGDARAFGFDGIYTQNRWTGSDAGVIGFVCAPPAIAAAIGLPLPPPGGQFTSRGAVTLEPLGIQIESAEWFNTATRARWSAFSSVFGAGLGDVAQGVLLLSA